MKSFFLIFLSQVVPHICDEIQDWVERVARVATDGTDSPPDLCVIELGGTVGDIESMPFVEVPSFFFAFSSSRSPLLICVCLYLFLFCLRLFVFVFVSVSVSLITRLFLFSKNTRPCVNSNSVLAVTTCV